jgi:hypothetical protein
MHKNEATRQQERQTAKLAKQKRHQENVALPET